MAAVPLTSSELELIFNEKLDNVLPSKEDIDLEPDATISMLNFADESLTGIVLKLSEEIKPHVKCKVILRNVFDCARNNIQTEFSSLDFGLPEAAENSDVLVNEILFNPRPTGVDFVEVVNHSEKYLNLKNWSLGNYESGKATSLHRISNENFLLKPGAYLVLTENINVLKGEYPMSEEKNFLELADMPSFSDDAGSVSLVDEKGLIIDHFEYTKELHSAFIRDKEGVSLERISFDEASQNFSNWKSASSVVSYATPGYLNSNARAEILTEESVKVVPEIFSPTASQGNFVQINYNFDNGGLVGTIKIIDAVGRVVKEIANNELLGTQGFFRWDGDTVKGTKARVGYYMVWFEAFDAAGTVNVFKRRVAVAGQF